MGIKDAEIRRANGCSERKSEDSRSRFSLVIDFSVHCQLPAALCFSTAPAEMSSSSDKS